MTDTNNDVKHVKNPSETLSFQELRARLKHIASLCWSLSVDLANEIELRERLQAENKGLSDLVRKLRQKHTQLLHSRGIKK